MMSIYACACEQKYRKNEKLDNTHLDFLNDKQFSFYYEMKHTVAYSLSSSLFTGILQYVWSPINPSITIKCIKHKSIACRNKMIVLKTKIISKI